MLRPASLAADLALTICRIPRQLLTLAALHTESAIGKARHAAADRRAARRESGAGEYPGIDRPLTFMERQARRRRDRDQG